MHVCIQAVSRSFCLKCSTKPLRPAIVRQHPRLQKFSTSRPSFARAVKQSRASKGIEEPLSRRKEKEIKSQQWTSLLKTQRLGKGASIIVVRDSEEKKSDNQAFEGEDISVKQVLLKDVDFEELWKAIEAHKSTPGQEEVNDAIEDIRPRPSDSFNNTLMTLSAEEYERAVLELSEGFNQLQLSRYISIQEGSKLFDTAEKSKQKRRTQGRIQRSDWMTEDEYGNGITASRPLKVYRGKAALVNVIIKDIWKFEVIDTTEIIGSLELILDTRNLPLLMSGGTKSPLAAIGQSYNVTMRVHERSNTLQVTGGKRHCHAAADAIELQIKNLYEEEFDLRPFKSSIAKAALTVADAQEIAQSVHCAVESVDAGRGLLIRSRNKADNESCRRKLVASVKMPDQISRKILYHSPQDHQGLFWTSELISQTKDTQRLPLYPGSFSSPSIISRGVSPMGLKAAQNPVTNDVTTSTLKFLDDISSNTVPTSFFTSIDNGSDLGHKPGWGVEVKTGYLAEFGDIQELAHSPMPQKLTVHQFTSEKSDGSLFAPSTLGLPNLLAQRFLDTPAKGSHSLVISLIPSPWNHWKLEASAHCPPLQVCFNVNGQTGALQLDSAFAISSAREANIILPNFASDLKVSRHDHLHLIEPRQVTGMAHFIKDIEGSALNFGRVSIPQFLNLQTPTSLLREPLPKSTRYRPVYLNDDKSMMEIEYFVSKVDRKQELVWDANSFDLVFTRTENGDAPQQDSLSVRASSERAKSAWSHYMSDNPKTESEDLDATLNAFAAEYKQRFLHKALEIGTRLSVSVGSNLRSRRVEAGVPGYSASGIAPEHVHSEKNESKESRGRGSQMADGVKKGGFRRIQLH